MTSSADQVEGQGLPPAISSMWRVCRLGYQHEPFLIVAAFVLAVLAFVPDAFVALWLALLGSALVRHDGSLLFVAATGMALSGVAT